MKLVRSAVTLACVLAFVWFVWSRRTTSVVDGYEQALAPAQQRAELAHDPSPPSIGHRVPLHERAPIRVETVVAAELELRVLDVRGKVVGDARIFGQDVSAFESLARLGTTDDSGTWRCAPPVRATRFVVTADGFSTSEILVDARSTGLREIVLASPGTIGGRVVDASGSAMSSEPWVLAYPDRHPPTKSFVAALLEDSSRHGGRAVLTRAGASGDFLLEGLDTRAAYTIVVAGGGVVAAQPTRGVVVGASELEVGAQPVFAGRLCFRDAGGGRLLRNSRVWQPQSPRWTWDPSVGAGVGADSLQAVLLGVPLEQTRREVVADGAVVLLASDTASNDCGPIHVEGKMLGHAPISTDVTLPRLRGAVPEVLLPMTSEGSTSGTLRIEMRGLAISDWTPTTQVQEIGSIVLAPRGGSETYVFKLFDWGNGVIELAGVPEDEYSIAINTQQGFLRHAPVGGPNVAVRGPSTNIVFDVSASCELELLIALRDDRLHAGEIAVEIGRVLADGSRHSTTLAFSGPPYVVHGLLPQTYSLTLYRPFVSSAPIECDIATTMDGARRAHVVFSEP